MVVLSMCKIIDITTVFKLYFNEKQWCTFFYRINDTQSYKCLAFNLILKFASHVETAMIVLRLWHALNESHTFFKPPPPKKKIQKQPKIPLPPSKIKN